MTSHCAFKSREFIILTHPSHSEDTSFFLYVSALLTDRTAFLLRQALAKWFFPPRKLQFFICWHCLGWWDTPRLEPNFQLWKPNFLLPNSHLWKPGNLLPHFSSSFVAIYFFFFPLLWSVRCNSVCRHFRASSGGHLLVPHSCTFRCSACYDSFCQS